MLSEFDLSSPPLASLNIQNYLFLDDDKEAECILSALGEETDSLASSTTSLLRYRVEFRGNEVSITSIEAEPHYIWHKHLSSEEFNTMYHILQRGVLPEILVDVVPALDASDVWPIVLVRSGQPELEIEIFLRQPPEPISKARSKSRGKEARSGKGSSKSTGRNAAKASTPPPATSSSTPRQGNSPAQLPSPSGLPSEFDFLDNPVSSSLHMFDAADWCSEDTFQHMSGLLSPAPAQEQKKASTGRSRSNTSKSKPKLPPVPVAEPLPLQGEMEADLPDFTDDWFDFSAADFTDYDVLSPSNNASNFPVLDGMESSLTAGSQHTAHVEPVITKDAEISAFIDKHLPVPRLSCIADQRRHVQHIIAGMKEHQKYTKDMYQEHYFISGDYNTAVSNTQRVILPLQLINLKVAPPAEVNPYRFCSPNTYMKSFEKLSYYDYSINRWVDKPPPLLMALVRPETEVWKLQNCKTAASAATSQQAPKAPRKKSQPVNTDEPAPKRKKYTKKAAANDSASPPKSSAAANGIHNTATTMLGNRAISGVKPDTQAAPPGYFAQHQHATFIEAPIMSGVSGHPVKRENGSLNIAQLPSAMTREQLNSSASYLHERQLTEAKHEFSFVDQSANMLLPGLRKDTMPVPPASGRGGCKKPTDGDVKRKGTRQQNASQGPAAATALAQRLKAQEQDRLIEAAAEKVLSMNSSNTKPFDPASLLPPGSGHLQGLLSSGMTPRLQQHAFPLTQNSMAFQPTTVYPYNYNQTPALPPNVKQAVNTIANSSLSMGLAPETLVPVKTTTALDRRYIYINNKNKI